MVGHQHETRYRQRSFTVAKRDFEGDGSDNEGDESRHREGEAVLQAGRYQVPSPHTASEAGRNRRLRVQMRRRAGTTKTWVAGANLFGIGRGR